ncbi:hypothetical protein CB1_000932082 [Camelus ferus]|nr:hypothetical protein CB1_000932082 [Camelus ferus]
MATSPGPLQVIIWSVHQEVIPAGNHRVCAVLDVLCAHLISLGVSGLLGRIVCSGPLPNTGCHFWLMVWQQKTKAVVMLNRIVEKESSDVRCRAEVNFHMLKSSGVLLMMEKGDDINIKQLLLNMRKYRMGLIQTPDQLRFSYMTIIEGAKLLKGDSDIQKRWKELSKEDLCPVFDHSPTKVMTEKYNGNRVGLEEGKLAGDGHTGLSSRVQDALEEDSTSALRKRLREDRKASTAQKVQQMKQRLSETERKRKRP